MNRYRINWKRSIRKEEETNGPISIETGEFKHWYRDLSCLFQIRLLSPMKYECMLYKSTERSNVGISSLGKRVTIKLAEQLCEQYVDEQVLIAGEEERIENKGW